MITTIRDFIKEDSNNTNTSESKYNKLPDNVKQWLKYKRYNIEDDLSLVIIGNVEISSQSHIISNNKLCWKFKEIKGNFNCTGCKLTTLENCPEIVKGDFYCADNKLTTLEHCPSIVNGNFNCSDNYITSLKHAPKIVNGNFYCQRNELTTLKHMPNIIKGDFYVAYNNITSLKYLSPRIIGEITFATNLKIKYTIKNLYINNNYMVKSKLNEKELTLLKNNI